ncbi:OmpH family outer membrane protein [Aquimarina sp. MMG015]|uniref:OmpH family outer membrane protein n=1 Tax=Aquimarina TaxID=290174 RepID=UPI000421D8E0|nr:MULTISPECIES: OmpH family outer membrane protein [Aquimarina]AXT57307.1 OmpH family outer membrane protein [Aquimarina sp. AD1]MBQ4801450.1 OmpH family outer membrane protein [Aquimarina sp. MMG015]RKN12263.1 OmpH family outer membrane protein [Aquimarina sp. AD1]
MRNFIWIAVAIIGLTSCNQQIEKTGFVNNTKVVSDFNEMKTAKEKWTKKNNEVRAELEEKAKQFQIEVQGYQNIMKSMSQTNREKKEQELMVKQQGLQREQQTRMQEIQQGSQAEIDSIISKVEGFIKEYGKKNGYTYIYGETEVKNLFYAKEELDLTDKIIEELNGEKTSNE